MITPVYFLLIAAAAVPVATTPQNALNVGQLITSIISLVAICGTIFATFYNKKAKTPADELARADFAYTKIKERLAEVDGDRRYLSETVEGLRESLKRADVDATVSMEEKRKLRNLIQQGDARIGNLEDQNRDLNERLDKIADKVKNGQAITLRDVYGDSASKTSNTDLGDVELTTVPER